jgi:hypothetical protein
VLEIHAPTLIYALVVFPLIALGLIAIRARQPLALEVAVRFWGVIFLAMALLMTWILINLRKTLRDDVAATAEILDATRTAGHLRVTIGGRAVEKAFRSTTFEKLSPGDRMMVLVDPGKETVLALGRVGG